MGKYRVNYNLASCQQAKYTNNNPDLLIHIGDMSDQTNMVGNPREVWRVSPDGALADRFKTLRNVFEMSEYEFFTHYANIPDGVEGDDSYIESCRIVTERLQSKIPELPWSHLYVASQLHNQIPAGSTIHLGILSPLRSWSYFDFHPTIEVYCNQGGFGIDGNMSSLLGASLINPNRIYYAVVGDLSFFYDMNLIGNRHVGNNIRILLVNNSLGAEFLLFKQTNIVTCINDIESYISAKDHFGHKSSKLVHHYAEDLGFEYLSANNKEEFAQSYSRFITPKVTEKPMIFEVFTDVENENEALKKCGV